MGSISQLADVLERDARFIALKSRSPNMMIKQDDQSSKNKKETDRGFGSVLGTITIFGGYSMMIWMIHHVLSSVIPTETNQVDTFTLWIVLITVPYVVAGWLVAYGPLSHHGPMYLSSIPALFQSFKLSVILVYGNIIGISVVLILYGIAMMGEDQSYVLAGLAIALGETGLILFVRKIVRNISSISKDKRD